MLPTGNRILPDTNAWIAYFAQDTTVIALLAQSEAICLSSVVVGELLFGAEKSGRQAANRARIEMLIETLPLLVCDAQTADYYARLRNRQRLLGKPIPENDLWIASHALQYGLILVTRDAHFDTVTSLSTTRW